VVGFRRETEASDGLNPIHGRVYDQAHRRKYRALYCNCQSQIAEGIGEGRWQRAEGRGQMTDDRGQMTEGR
jgi:hypothetical protein